MANDYRDKDRDRGYGGGHDRSRGRGYGRDLEESSSRGMFGYEGEGFMRGSGDAGDYDDFARRGYGRDAWSDESNYRGYGLDRPSGTDAGYRGGGNLGGGYSGGRSVNPPYRGQSGVMDQPNTGGRGNFGATGYRDIEQGWSDRDRGGERPSFRGRGPKNYQRSDDRIREDVCERLSLDHDVDASEIEVNVSGATVTLTGTVTDRNAKRRAEDLAESVVGVKDVENQIRVAREGNGGSQ